MARMNQSIKNHDDYVIRSCTNTGVWLVDKQDLQTGQLMVTYDFVNREYSAPQMGPDPVSMDNMADRERQEFLSLQKKLNKALLDEGKS